MTPQTGRLPSRAMPETAALETPLPRPRYDLADYLGMLRRGWWLLVAAAVLGAVAALGIATAQTKVYESSTAVLVLPTGVQSADLAGGRTKSTINLDTEAQLVQSSATANLAKKLADSPAPAAELLRAVSVTVPPNTAILEITYAAETARAARTGSAAFAAAYLQNRRDNAKSEIDTQIEALETQISRLEKQLRDVLSRQDERFGTSDGASYLDEQQQNLSSQLNTLNGTLNELETTSVSGGRVISEAQLPTDPSQPVLPLNLAAGLMVGLLLGVTAVAAREYLDRRVHHGADVVRRAGVPLLCELTDRQTARSAPTADSVFGAFTPAGRMFSRLRNEVAACLPAGSVVVVTGACRGPAAPTLSANLAVAFTRAGNTAAVVYADTPGAWDNGDAAPATQLFGVPMAPGMSDVLAGRVELDDALRSAARHPDLRVLPTGAAASSGGLLQSDAARKLLTALKSRVEYVIVHAPSTAESADAQSLAIHADGVLLGVDLRRTTDVEVADAADQLHRVGTPLLGAVVLAPVTAPKNPTPTTSPSKTPTPNTPPRPEAKPRKATTAAGGDVPTLVFPRITDDHTTTDTETDADSSRKAAGQGDGEVLETPRERNGRTPESSRAASSATGGRRQPNQKRARGGADPDATLVITGGPTNTSRPNRDTSHKSKGRRR